MKRISKSKTYKVSCSTYLIENGNIADFIGVNFYKQKSKKCEFSVWCPNIIYEEMVAIFVNVFMRPVPKGGASSGALGSSSSSDFLKC